MPTVQTTVAGRSLASAVNVTTTAGQLPATPLKSRKTMYIFNNNASGGSVLYIGDATVTAGTGIPVPPQSGISLPFTDTVPVYGITSAGTADARVLEGG